MDKKEKKININPLILVMEGYGHIKYYWLAQDQFKFEDRYYMFAMETMDCNTVFDMEKSITALQTRNYSTLRQEYKGPQPHVKQKRLHDYLIT